MPYYNSRLLFIVSLVILCSAVGSAQTLYWVGENGDWNDPANWSTTSGGPGDAGVPDGGTAVVFDGSFGNCTISSAAQCRSVQLGFGADVVINAEWEIRDSLVHTSGDIVMENTIRCGAYIATGATPRVISGSNRSFVVTGDPGHFESNTEFFENLGIKSLTFETNKGILKTTSGQLKIESLEFKGDGEVYGNHLIDAWTFAAGRTVFLENGSTQRIFKEFKTGDFCGGRAHVLAFLDNPERAILQFESDVADIEIRGFYFRRIRGENIINGRPDNVFYVDGIDGGDNENMFSATTQEPRTLYWVSGSGDWLDQSHWSLSSGGAGGQCVPSAVDIVIFDDNSFVTPTEDRVRSNAPVYVSQLRFEATNKSAFLDMHSVNLRHNLFLSGKCFWDIPDLFVVGVDNTIDLSLTTNGVPIKRMILNSGRNVNLGDNLKVGELIFEDYESVAVFNSQGHDIEFGQLIALKSGMSLDLSNSKLIGRWFGFNGAKAPPLTKDQSFIQIVDTDLKANNTVWDIQSFFEGGVILKDVDMGTFLVNQGGITQILKGTYLLHMYLEGQVNFKTLDIDQNLKIYDGNITTDSLLFYTNKTYQLEPTKSLTVNTHFSCDGDMCTPVRLQSRVAGDQADLVMSSSATLAMRNTNIKDINATGGNTFDSGSGSLDLGNNTGWSFRDPNAVERDEFLGPDTLICNDIQGSFIIALTLSEDDVDSIQWNEGVVEEYEFGDRLLLPGKNQPQQEYDVIARIVYSNGCSATDTLRVTIDEAFEIALPADTLLCNNQSITLSDLNSNPDVTYTWDGSSVGNTYEVSKAGDYSVVGQKGGCRSEATVTVDQIDLTQYSLGQDVALCGVTGYTLSVPDDFSGSQVWQDGSAADSLIVTISGEYWVEFSQDVCTHRDTVAVRIDSEFTIDLGPDTTLCNGANIALRVGRDAGVFEWNNGATTPAILVDQGGEYIATVTVGECSATDTIVVTAISQKPPILGQDQVICETDSLVLSVVPEYLGEFEWSTGESSKDIVVTQSGDYVLTFINDICRVSDTISIVAEPAITVDLGQDTIICNEETLLLDATADDGSSYLWNTGATTPTITVDGGDTYSVTVSKGACQTTDEVAVGKISLNSFSIQGDSIACEGDTIILRSPISGAAVNILWQDGFTESERAITTGGEYSLTATLQGCSASAIKKVTFEKGESVDLGEDQTVCAPETVVLDPGLSNATYIWQDGSTTDTYTVTETGTYTVTATSGACTSSDEVVITVQDQLSLQIADTDEINKCVGDTVRLAANTGAGQINYLWQDMSAVQEFIATESGLYYATMTFGACEVRDTVMITFHEYPVVDLGDDIEICEGQKATIAAPDGDGYTYQWVGSAETTPTVEASISGIYRVTVTDRHGCSTSDEVVLTANAAPIFDLGEDRTICEGEETTITATPEYSGLQWNIPGMGNTATTAQGGIVKATADLNGCTYTDSVVVSVQEYPVIALGGDTTICESSSIVLDATNANATYTWSNGEASSSINVSQAGTYSVSVDLNGCKATGEITVSTKETPTFELKMDETICEGTSTVVSISNPGTWSIEWSNGETSDEITVTEAGTYGATATLDGCQHNDRFSLQIEPLPVFDLGEDFAKCDDVTASLQVGLSGVSVVWRDRSTGPTYSVTTAGRYSATATTALGCTYTDEIEVASRACAGYQIYIPNAFSPNGDSRNDQFQISVPSDVLIQQYELNVYDRWGGRVFTSSNINDSWKGLDGNGKKLNPGVYSYTLSVMYSDDYKTNQTDKQAGTILLVK